MADAGGFVPTFKEYACVKAYADLNHYSLEREEPILHDLDSVAAWTKAPAVPVDCGNALTAWEPLRRCGAIDSREGNRL